MSEITSKVEEILKVREHDGANGKVWYYKLAMDNGDVGEIGKKKPDFFKVGDSLTYTIETGQYGNKFKAVQTSNGFNVKGSFKVNEADKYPSFALAYSKDLIAAKLARGDDMSATQIADGTLWLADKFLDWLNKHKA